MPEDPDCKFPTRTGPAFPLQVPWTTFCDLGTLFFLGGGQGGQGGQGGGFGILILMSAMRYVLVLLSGGCPQLCFWLNFRRTSRSLFLLSLNTSSNQAF